MSEHKEFLPPSPPTISSSMSLAEENSEKQQLLHLDTNDLPTPPLTPAISKNENITTVLTTFEEHKSEVFEESQRLLNEIRDSEKLVNETHESLKNEVPSEKNEVPSEKNEVPSEKNEVLENVLNLTNLVTLFLSQEDTVQKYNLPVSDKTKLVLSKLLSIDHYFDNIEEIMKDIVRDNKIDARDVPKIMLLLSELYNKLKQLKDVKFDEKLCGEVLKILFNVALKEKLIPINEQDLDLIKCVYEIVDTSITLMQTDTSGTKKGIVYVILKLLNSCKK